MPVRTEAREAARRERLVPVMIESVMPPLEFRSFETADVSDWQGDPGHENFREITEALVVGAHAARRAPEPDVRGMDSSRCDR